MISTDAGSSRVRAGESDVSPSARRIAAAAARCPLGEPQQREARLRLPPAPARLAVGLLGGGELAAQPKHLALQVGRLTGRRPFAPARPRPARRASSSASGHAPCEQQDLRAVRQAAAGERDHVGLLLAPAVSAAVHSWARRGS